MRTDKRFRAAVLSLLLLAALLPAADRRDAVRLSLLGGWNLFAASGGNSHYVAGTNDFPLVPAYGAPALGVGAAFFITPRFAWGIDLRYGVSAAVDLRDPSDGETIRVDSPGYLTAVTGGQFHLPLSASLVLVAAAGAGVEYRRVEGREFISGRGSRIIIEAPEKPLAPLLGAGICLQVALNAALALGVECRATVALRESAKMVLTPALVVTLGL